MKRTNALAVAALAGLLGGVSAKAAPAPSSGTELAQQQKESCNNKADSKKSGGAKNKKSGDKESCQAKKGKDKSSCSGKSGCKSMPEAV